MLKKIKQKNSILIIVGIIILIVGIYMELYKYFEERRHKVFSNINVTLYENNQPENIIETTEEHNHETKEDINSNKNNVSTYLGVLEIPKIKIKTGFYNLDSKYNNIDQNITVIKGSTYPNEPNNNLILAAHSGDCSVCYFENLYKLNLGDVANLSYKNIKYSYKLVDVYEVEKNGTVAIYRDYSKNVLTLITCTRNSDIKQTVYILEQI